MGSSDVLIEVEERPGIRQLRSEPRMTVLLSGELRSRLGTSPCRIHDISRGGACLDADRTYAAGEKVTFVRGGLSVNGTVAWSRGRKFGITFDEPIRATDLLVQMSHSRSQAAKPQPAVSAVARPPFPSR
jgi:hypothetical protein